MNRVPYAVLRQNLARYMDKAADSRAPILVTRQGRRGNVVLLSEAEFRGWQETVHLLRSPANASHLLQSVDCARSGQTGERKLVSAENPDNQL